MTQQIKKKFIGADQIDGSKIKLLEGQAVRGTNSLGEEVDLVKIGSGDKVEVLGQEVALKSELDQEALDRQSGDAELQSQLDDLDGYAQETRSDLDDLDGYAQEIRSDLDEEVTAREQGDSTLQTQIDDLAGVVQGNFDLQQTDIDGIRSDIDFLTSETQRLDIAVNDVNLSLQDEIVNRQLDLQSEEQARIAGDQQALEDAKAYADQKIADLVGSAPEILDTLEEIADALQDEQSVTGVILSQLADHEQRIESLESEKEVLEFEALESFPISGMSSKIYIAKDSNKLYRFEESEGGELELPVAPAAPELVVTTSITPADDLQATIDAANDGDVIFLVNGTYSLAGVTISKRIALVGESQDGVLIQDTRTDSQTFMNILADNVTLKDLTVRHVTSDSNIGIAIAVSGSGFPQVRLNNFRMYNVKSQYSKGGLSIRSNNFVVEGCTFEVVAGSSTRRGILHYGNGGDSFIKNNLFINATTGALRAICPTSTSGSNPSDEQAGSLTIEGSTFSGNLSQFINMDNHQGAPGSFELIVKDNVTPETNAFVVSFGGIDNFGDLFSRVVLIGNTLTNNHSSGLGKGILAIDGINGPRPFRSSALPVISSANVLGQLDFRVGYAEAAGSTGAIVGYATGQITEPVVEISEGADGAEGAYVELSATIDQDLTLLEEKIEALEGDLDEEVAARIGGDEQTLEDAKAYSDQKIAELVGAAPELLDTLEEIAEALQDEQTATAAILSQLGDHEQRIVSLESEKEVLEFDNKESFPVGGVIGKIYVAKNNNLLYRFESGDYLELSPSVERDLTEIIDRLEVIEPKVTSLEENATKFAKGSQTVGANLEYIDLDREYKTILSVSVGRLAVHEDEDYTVSVVGGVTRLTWINSLAHPDGEESIETGYKVFYSGEY
jgi:hypothetical protein